MTSSNFLRAFLPIAVVGLGLVACSDSKKSASASVELPTSALPENYHLAAEPANARDVLIAKTELKDGEPVVLRGRVQDFVNGMAAFTLTDGALKSCDQEGPMKSCETPWDYCCTDPAELNAASAVIEFRDGEAVRRTDARGFHGLDHLKWVTVKGIAKTDDKGNLTVIADGIYVKP
ncbi:MAG: hypothetical protein K8S98_05585 [Planctomycetes bacterium]|nr:hypothetical protein [Planctomycetota bacterium]